MDSGIDDDLETPADRINNCRKGVALMPLEPAEEESKLDTPRAGLIRKQSLQLVKYEKLEFPVKP